MSRSEMGKCKQCRPRNHRGRGIKVTCLQYLVNPTQDRESRFKLVGRICKNKDLVYIYIYMRFIFKSFSVSQIISH